MEILTIEQSIKALTISRSTLYRCLKEYNIETVKKDRKSYLYQHQVSNIKEKIKMSHSQKYNETVETDKNLKKLLKIMQEKNEKLLLQLGESKGRAKTLEEQNNKIIFQIGRATEKIIMLENEKLREIEIRSEKLKQGFFRKTWEFLTKTP
jgi:hypothetical protein